MRDDVIAAVQARTGCSVEAFLSDDLHDPDVAVEIFLMAAATATADTATRIECAAPTLARCIRRTRRRVCAPAESRSVSCVPVPGTT
jgi:hypothetical protein